MSNRLNVSAIAWRSLRREWRGGDLRIVAFALIVATAAVVSVAAFGDRLGQTLARQGSELLGADLVVHVQSPPRAEWITRANEIGLGHALTVSFRSVVVAEELTQLVEIKAVESGLSAAWNPAHRRLPRLPGPSRRRYSRAGRGLGGCTVAQSTPA